MHAFCLDVGLDAEAAGAAKDDIKDPEADNAKEEWVELSHEGVVDIGNGECASTTDLRSTNVVSKCLHYVMVGLYFLSGYCACG